MRNVFTFHELVHENGKEYGFGVNEDFFFLNTNWEKKLPTLYL